MGASSQNIAVNFKVSGNELSAYLESIQKKSDKLTQKAIAGAVEQSNKSKEQVQIINEQIKAIERKNKIELEANRSIITSIRDSEIKRIHNAAEAKRDEFRRKSKSGEMTAEGAANAIDRTYKNETTDVARIRTDAKEELNLLREQDKQNKLQTSLSREAILTAKEAARENVHAIRSGDKTIADVYREVGNNPNEEEKLTLQMIQDSLQLDRKNNSRGNDGQFGFLGSLMTADNINKIISTAGQFAQTQNGFDLIQPASNMAGRIGGAIIGAIIGGLASGGTAAIAGAGIGASIGGGIGDTIGALEQREAMSKETFFKARNRYRSVTGDFLNDGNIFDLESVGVSATDYMSRRVDYARQRGFGYDSNKTTMDALLSEKAYGIDPGVVSNIITLQRSTNENNRDLAALIGGVVEKGANTYFKNGNTTFLNEFLTKFSTLQKELLKTQATVSTGTTYDILSKFNNIGGAFATSDPRSAGLISTINSSLSNPNTDFKKALSFYALKKRNPNMNIADLIEEQQKGLGSSNYLMSMMGLVDGMGGDDGAKRTNFAGLLGLEGQQKFATDLYRAYKSGKFKGDFNQDELKSLGFDMKGRADENTTDLERNQAKIENGILGGEAIDKMADAFVVAIKAMLGGAVINLNDGKGTITILSNQTISQNLVKKAKEQNEKIANYTYMERVGYMP